MGGGGKERHCLRLRQTSGCIFFGTLIPEMREYLPNLSRGFANLKVNTVLGRC